MHAAYNYVATTHPYFTFFIAWQNSHTYMCQGLKQNIMLTRTCSMHIVILLFIKMNFKVSKCMHACISDCSTDEMIAYANLPIIYIEHFCCQRKILMGENLTDTEFSNIWWKILWQMVTVFHHAPVNAVMLLKIDGLYSDNLAGKHQKCQKFLPVKILCCMVPLDAKQRKFIKFQYWLIN